MTETIELVDGLFRDGDVAVGCLVAAFLFVLGSAVASFAGLVAYRLKTLDPDVSILKAISWPPSHCEGCGTGLRARDLVPVFGWLASGGRCARCGTCVPVRYPITELLLGAVVAAFPFAMGGLQVSALPILAVLVAFTIAVVDWENAMVPEELTWGLLFCGLCTAALEADPEIRIYGAGLGALLAWLMTTVPGWLKGADTRAWGDVAMAAAVGAWLGTFAVIPALVAAAILHLAIGVAARAHLARHTPEGEDGVWVPFGPALMAAFVAAIPIHPVLRGLLSP